ncbi:MAG: flagellar assembly protein FliW [Nocardioides sp.]
MPTDIPVLEMVSPMVGFPEQRHFALARLDDTGVVCDLRSLENPDLSFVVVPPHMFFSDYHPEVDDEVVRALGIESADDLVTLVVVTLGEQPGDATANLLAPVLINHHTRRAAQVLLADADLPLRAPLTA